MSWTYSKFKNLLTWEFIEGEGAARDILAIIENFGDTRPFLVSLAVDMKNCGHYRTLTDAKKAALMDGLSDAKFAPISTEDGYSQEFINSTL